MWPVFLHLSGRIKRYVVITYLSFFIVSCGVQINQGIIDIPSDLSSVEAGTTTYLVDQTDDDDSVRGFGGGTHIGTSFSNNVLTLNTATNNSNLSKDWTPKWSNLQAYLQFENNYNDSSDEGNDATPYNSPGFGAAKVGDNALSTTFNGGGIGQYARISSTSSLNITDKVTVMAWIKPTTSTEDGIIIRNAGGTGTQYSLIYRAGETIGFQWYDGSFPSAVSVSSITPNTGWYHICAVRRSGNVIEVYINGVLDSTTAGTATTGTGGPIYIGANGGNAGQDFDGLIDEVAIWDTDLNADEVLLIYSRQSATYAGEMKSRVMDSKESSSQWTNLNWVTTLPFGKQLPPPSISETSSNYSSLVGSNGLTGDNDLIDQLVGLWHFNGNANDETIYGNDFTVYGSPEFGPGMFDNAYVNFDGATQYLNLSGFDEISSWPVTVSFWVKYDQASIADTSTRGIFAFHRGEGSFFGVKKRSTGDLTIQVRHDAGGTNAYIHVDSNLTVGWHHIVLRFIDNTSLDISIDGQYQFASSTTRTMPFFTGAERIFIAKKRGSDTPAPIDGFDELAIWSRVLGEEEIQQLYRRGANRIIYQVRSCASSDCSDQDALTGDGWIGPGGNYLTYFSELYNKSSISSSCTFPQECYASELSLDGEVNTTSPSIYFNDFGTDGLLGADNNRYFQYRVIMESDDKNTICNGGTSTCMPELKSVTVGPEHSYEE